MDSDLSGGYRYPPFELLRPERQLFNPVTVENLTLSTRLKKKPNLYHTLAIQSTGNLCTIYDCSVVPRLESAFQLVNDYPSDTRFVLGRSLGLSTGQ